MEFVVEFEVSVPRGTPKSEVRRLELAEASAAADLAAKGYLLRLWNTAVAAGQSKVVGLYRADSRAQLDRLLAALPLFEWMRVAVTPLAPHPNDPALARLSTQHDRP